MELISSYSSIRLFRRRFGGIYVFLNIEPMFTRSEVTIEVLEREEVSAQ
uniref:Uncharacterized protein n=1 Tax=Lepeophtheirus salmonis TaxID=72036 RepID=A0A0K2UM64_LEPSM